jgi:micrococcal nuclease
MNKKLPVSVGRVARLLRLTGLPRLAALIGAILLIGLISLFFDDASKTIRPAAAQSSAQSKQKGTFALTGKVVRVSDGDTIQLLVDRQSLRIRLASIDAPETGHGSARPGQPFGEASRQNLAHYVAGKTLTLVCYEKDRYDRAICDVPVGDTTANRLQVQSGMAWANQQGGGKYLRDHSVRALEQQARTQKLGVWSEPHAVAPWLWRDLCWQKQKCAP